MTQDFTNKRVLVTGGTRGIGFATTQAFLSAGARVAINGRSEASTKAAMTRFGLGDNLIAASGDVSNAAGCRTIVDAAIAGLGGLDVLVNSAGVGIGASVAETTEADWDATLDVNLKGVFFCCQAALDALRTSGGNIVNLASDSGLMGELNLSAYCASKGGVVNMTRAMALELAPDIRVNCVCPGYVDTDMVRAETINTAPDPEAKERALKERAPLNRLGSPQEIASAILYLASDTARFATGTALQMDGGTTAGR